MNCQARPNLKEFQSEGDEDTLLLMAGDSHNVRLAVAQSDIILLSGWYVEVHPKGEDVQAVRRSL